jgi:hypothetical protein
MVDDDKRGNTFLRGISMEEVMESTIQSYFHCGISEMINGGLPLKIKGSYVESENFS